jgi:hypothetical protein
MAPSLVEAHGWSGKGKLYADQVDGWCVLGAVGAERMYRCSLLADVFLWDRLMLWDLEESNCVLYGRCTGMRVE